MEIWEAGSGQMVSGLKVLEINLDLKALGHNWHCYDENFHYIHYSLNTSDPQGEYCIATLVNLPFQSPLKKSERQLQPPLIGWWQPKQ